MPKTKPETPKEHVEVALRLLDWVGDPSNPSRQEDAIPSLLAANAHASLAVAKLNLAATTTQED